MSKIKDFNKESYWMGINELPELGEISGKSILVMHWNAPYAPGDYQESDVAWFEDIKGVAGYIKYKVLKEKAYSMFGKEGYFPDPENASLEDYLSFDMSCDAYIEDAQKILRRCANAIDEAFDADEEGAKAIVKECINMYNEYFDKSPYKGGIDLVIEWDDIRPFMDGPFENYSNMEDFLIEVIDAKAYGN